MYQEKKMSEEDKPEMRLVIYKALCFDVAQGRMNGSPNEARTHSCRFVSLACQPLHHQSVDASIQRLEDQI